MNRKASSRIGTLGPRVVARLKGGLRRRIGLWPLLEMRNRLLMSPGALKARLFEEREVRRLKRALRPMRHTAVATVIPTYRRPDSLRQAVVSALRQTVEDQVVIVVDDGGGLPELPADERLHTVSLSRNTAVLGLVRNVGIRLTRSTYVAFLDDDNEWDARHLEVALSAFQSASCVAAYTAVERHRSDGTPVDVLSRDFDRKSLSDEPNYLDINSVVVRRDGRTVFSRIPRTKSTVPKEDWEFIYRISRHGAVTHISVPTVRYLVNDNSYYTDWRREGS